MLRTKRTAWALRVWVVALFLLVAALSACERGDAPPDPIPTVQLTDGSAPAATTDPAAPSAAPVAVVDQGFGQDGATVAYGFTLHNPDPTTSVEDIAYEVVFNDEEGEFLATDAGHVAVLLPGQTLGVAASIAVFEGDTAAEIDVRLAEGSPVATGAAGGFTVEGAQYFTREITGVGTGVVSGLVGASIDRPIQDVRVSALTRDATGAINGGGFTYISFLAPGDRVGVAVYVNGGSDVATVELHPAHPPLSQPDLPRPATPLELLDFGFGASDFDAGYALIIRNPNEQAVQLSRYHVTAYDDAGAVVGTDEGYIDLLLPGQTLAVGGSLIPQAGQPAARLEARLLDGAPADATGMQPFTTADVAFVADDIFPRVTGRVNNPHENHFVNVRVSAVGYDDAGRIVGGGLAFVDVVGPNAGAPATVPVTFSGTPARVELYAAASVLSEE